MKLRDVRSGIVWGIFAGMVAASLTYAVAQIVPALPFQLQNNTTADATQVMANFNQILTNVNTNGAKNGANSDITSLLGLTTPLAPSVGGTTTFTGGSSTGTANAQVVTPVVPSAFALAVGTRVVFVASLTNTAAMTLNVAASGVKNVYRQTYGGITPMAGGEILSGMVIEVIYDGTQYQRVSAPVEVGKILDYAGSSPPAGYALANGQCVSQTTYPMLFAIIGSGWGACGAGTFTLPDLRGRTGIGPDAGANRVTVGGSGCAATLALGCGAQNQTIAQANLPAVTWPNTLGFSQSSGTSNRAGIDAAGHETTITASGAVIVPTNAAYATQTITVTGTISGSVTSGGSGTPVGSIPPVLVVTKMIKL